MKLKATSLITALVLAMGSSAASAFSLYPGDANDPGTQLEDDDVDYFIDNDGDDLISVGDVLIAPFEFSQIIDILSPISASSPQNLTQAFDELTGVSTIKVKEIDLVNERVIFEQDGNTPMIAIYSDTGTGVDLDVTDCGLRASCVSDATDGAGLWASFSIDAADPDTAWIFNPIVPVGAALDPSVIADALQTTKFGTANFALNLVTNNTGYDLDQFDMGAIQCTIIFGPAGCPGDQFVSFVGSADILGAFGYTDAYDAVNNPDGAFARSDADVALNPQRVPEPTTLALMGMGILGIGAMRRRKKA